MYIEFWYLKKWLLAVMVVKIVKQPHQYLKRICHVNQGKTNNNNNIHFNVVICGWQFLLQFALTIFNCMHPLFSSNIDPNPSLHTLPAISLVDPSSFSQLFKAP